ncbi:MAG: DUF5752 family protein [Candidatus Nanoarchaeia archaeon]|nr:DUF5752 family protein [Candidatus Nanoarchaeia archaeon]
MEDSLKEKFIKLSKQPTPDSKKFEDFLYEVKVNLKKEVESELNSLKNKIEQERKDNEKFLRYLSKVEDRLKNLEKKQLHGPIHPELYFKLKNGAKVSSIHELLTFLKDMDETTFNHHITSIPNDFSLWIKDVLKLKDLAEEIKSLKNKDKLITIISEYIE